MDRTDSEIQNASEAIDEALARMTKENRGETARSILEVVRNLNDHIAFKLWRELEPDNPRNINKVAKYFENKKPYQFIARFDKYLRSSVSHFTPNKDGAERLLIKYYRFLIELKQLMIDRYGIEIINNIDNFLPDIDEQTKEYHEKIAYAIETVTAKGNEVSDNYYINRIIPFFVNRKIYYEITLEPALEKINKFNRITVFSKSEILPNYSVALKFTEKTIHIFDTDFPIKIITEWSVSIRPCEFKNFGKILGISIQPNRINNDYKGLMEYLKERYISLLDIVDMSERSYANFRSSICGRMKNERSKLIDLLSRCRQITKNKINGVNTVRYLLLRMNNRLIKLQWPDSSSKRLKSDLFLSSKCYPFECNPFSFSPKDHVADLGDLFEGIEINGREEDLLARQISNNIEQNGILYTDINEFSFYGDNERIRSLIRKYNNNLYVGFKPYNTIGVYDKYLFIKGYEDELTNIISKLKQLSGECSNYNDCFEKGKISALKVLPNANERLDDPDKERVLVDMFKNSRVHLIYGAAGTGKSTLINHIAKLMSGKNRIFLAQTNPAIENLRHRVIDKQFDDEFITINRFVKAYKYRNIEYDLIVVDECSTVTNKEISQILDLLGNGILVLAGDIYQIPAIGFGNWFTFAKNILDSKCWSELVTPFRSTDEELKAFWKEVRIMKEGDCVLEEDVRNEYSHKIDSGIFKQKSKDEIILCLNYNGLYGLNNINKLLQLGNHNPGVVIDIFEFKIGDPILFNDSERFNVLYNNLKGHILAINDFGNYVRFTVEVELFLEDNEVNSCQGLTFEGYNKNKTCVSFNVNRRRPYASDDDEVGNEHILPFQIAYAVSIHKSQGLEYESVKIVIADDSEERITHSIFYTAITRARKYLTIFWSPEVCNRVLKQITGQKDNRDYLIFTSRRLR